MAQTEIYISDDAHGDYIGGPFESFEAALAELRRLASIAWDAPPNQAPCTSWRTCGRDYHIMEYDASGQSNGLLRDVPVLDISSKGTKWIAGFEQAWESKAK